MSHCTTPVNPATRMATRTGPALWMRLAVSGWQIRFWADADRRPRLDVIDSENTPASQLAGTFQPAVSIEDGWTMCGCLSGGDGKCWALAVGQAPGEPGHVVSFARQAPTASRTRMTLPPQSGSGLWLASDGLWVAASTGCYTHVRLTARSATRLRPLRPVEER